MSDVCENCECSRKPSNPSHQGTPHKVRRPLMALF